MNPSAERGVVLRAPGDALINTGFEEVLRHRDGVTQRIRIAPARKFGGLQRLEGWGELIFGTDTSRSVVYEFGDDGRFSLVSLLPSPFSVAAPFRGGWVTVMRGGSLIEHHRGTGTCSDIGLELGVAHRSKVLVDRGDEYFLVDRADPELTPETPVVWVHPLPPAPPATEVF